MARPKKQGLDYFSFDCDFFQDEKVVAIAGEFGLKGEIVIIHLLCAIYRNGYFYKWDELAKMKMLHELPGVNAELLDKIVSRLLLWDFFDRGLFESSIVLTSRGIQKRYFEATKWRTPSEDLPYIFEDLEFCKSYRCKIGVLQKKTPIKQELMPQIKGNKIRKSTVVDKRTAAATAKEKSLKEISGDEIALLRQDSEWCETVCTQNGINAPRLNELLEDFGVNCRAREIRHTDLRDAKNHFLSWLKKLSISLKQPEYETNRPGVSVQRRGTDPPILGEKNYHSSF
jgi:hypothetical protein